MELVRKRRGCCSAEWKIETGTCKQCLCTHFPSAFASLWRSHSLVEVETLSHLCTIWDILQLTCTSSVGCMSCHGLIFIYWVRVHVLRMMFQVALHWNRCNYICPLKNKLFLVILVLRLRYVKWRVAICLFHSCLCPRYSHARMRDSLLWYHWDASKYELLEDRDQWLYLRYWMCFLQKCSFSRGRGRCSNCGQIESVAVEGNCKANIPGCLKGSCGPTLYEWLQMHFVGVIYAAVGLVAVLGTCCRDTTKRGRKIQLV